MRSLNYIAILFVGCLFIPEVTCSSLSDAKSLLTALTTSYNKNLRPKLDQSLPTVIELEFYLKSISSLDEVEGVLTTIISLHLTWNDEALVWDPVTYGGLSSLKIPESLIWTPVFITSNPAAKITKIGNVEIPVSVESNGMVNYQLADYLQTTCDVDVTYFPFDVQNCIIELLPWGYEADINLNLTADKLDAIRLDVFSENNVWILKSYKSENALLGGIPYAKLTLTLERRYAFFILNLFSPVLIMAFLNAMVFVLPADSGERVGYAITCLLALAVYMTFASESLPTSSKPIPILIYVLLTFMCISTFMCVEVIIGLRFHLADDSSELPKSLTKILFCTCKDRSVITVQPTDEEFKTSSKQTPEEKITWKQLGCRFDKYCLFSNIFIMILLTLVYLILVINGN